ncbi:MAG: hypothetical protein B6D79_03830 [gamma proteobacterium symbiont of Ctena orbiculata]|nr:MAG: hypothetical protein B6D79_03830 [gamma proteobacterium symbiont of Ctena orbiculata]
MSEKRIFISYRRDDVPGYVARLEDDLEKEFGEHTVFRDVEDIAGGTEWKEAIDSNLKSSTVLVLVIGQHWSRIWKERQDDPVNHVALELQRAHELGVPIIPITMNGGTLDPGLDLGDVAWLRGKQMYDISDRQGRWQHDLRGLVALLERMPGLNRRGPLPPEPIKSKAWPWFILAGLVMGVIVFGLMSGRNAPQDASDQDHRADDSEPVNEILVSEDKQVAGGTAAQADREYSSPPIAGKWVSVNDGTLYVVESIDSQRFYISSPGYGNGEGEFIPGMPRKFRITIEGVGYGEYSLSNTNDKVMGWFVESDSGDKVYETLTRLK